MNVVATQRATGVTGVVFCGGKSSRMGADKALLVDAKGRALIERALATLDPWVDELCIACGPSARYGELGRRQVLDRIADGGPLAGLEAALSAASTPWIYALACDLPRADGAVFARLLERAQRDDLDACWLSTAAGDEPLYAVYSTRCLPAVRAALDAGQRRMNSFLDLTIDGRALRVGTERTDVGELAFNVNTPADWDRYRKEAR